MRKIIVGLLIAFASNFAFAKIEPSELDIHLVNMGGLNNDFKIKDKSVLIKEYSKLNNMLSEMFPQKINNEVEMTGVNIRYNMIHYYRSDLTLETKNDVPITPEIKDYLRESLLESACAVWSKNIHTQVNRELAYMTTRAKDQKIFSVESVENSECNFD